MYRKNKKKIQKQPYTTTVQEIVKHNSEVKTK